MYREYRPSEALRSVVTCTWSLRSDGAAHRVLPDACMDILFRRPLPGPGEARCSTAPWRAEVVGTMTRAIVAEPLAVEYLGVRFRPGEASRFFDLAAREATDRSFGLGEVWGAVAAEIEERLSEAASDEARLRVLDDALARRLARARPADFRVRRAVRALAGGAPAVEVVAADVGLGLRQLHRLFEERVGVGPKVVHRVLRLQRAVALLRSGAPASWASIASAAGYFDQPHLVREFHALAGVRPSAYLARPGVSDSSKPGEGGAGMHRP